jgi:hypothetical protein
MSGYVLRGDYPKRYQDMALNILDKAKFVRNFIYDNFQDVFQNYSDLVREIV